MIAEHDATERCCPQEWWVRKYRPIAEHDATERCQINLTDRLKMENNQNKNLIAAENDETRLAFAQRVSRADFKTRSRYNAIKNAFSGYIVPSKGIMVWSKVGDYGEEFYLDNTLLGRVRLVRGYVRLFLALKPSKYSPAKYHNNDYSRSARYGDCPLEINICNANRVKCAYSLIGELLQSAGAMPDKNHLARDCSVDYDGLSYGDITFDPADMAAADEEILDNDIVEDEVEPSPENIPVGSFYGTGRAVIPQSNVADGRAQGASRPTVTFFADYNTEVLAPSPVRLPRRAKVVDAEGAKIGKVRGSVWYDLEGNEVGAFERDDDDSVYYYQGGNKKGFLDRNDNVISLSNDYIATLRRFPAMIVLLILLLLVAATALSVCLSAYYLNRSENLDYAPVLFVADEYGDSWAETENIGVFYNEMFGTEKIAPGMKGSYAFYLSNENADPLEFSLEFSCINEYGIDLAFSLYRDGILLAGGEEGADKVSPEELSTYGMTIQEESDSLFVLEWEWRHNDEVDTEAGINQASYTLNIEFTAWVQGS